MNVIQAAYIGWRKYLKGPPMQSLSLIHQFLNVQAVHKWRAIPIIINTTPTSFKNIEWFIIDNPLIIWFIKVANSRSAILIPAPFKPTPNILFTPSSLIGLLYCKIMLGIMQVYYDEVFMSNLMKWRKTGPDYKSIFAYCDSGIACHKLHRNCLNSLMNSFGNLSQGVI